MMNKSTYTNWQVFALVGLRILIGWHFLYEGLIKVFNPAWSSASFLAEAQGPVANMFKLLSANSELVLIIDFFNEWGLVLIGVSLIIGLLSRWACLGGIVLLFLYYISNPPFIGHSSQQLTEGNYLIVNMNLIEIFALIVLFFHPTEQRIGIQRFFWVKTKS